MPQIKPGHRLYLYRLFSRELGVGKQTALDRAAAVLDADGLAPADLGFDDARSLFEALDECVKLTVFKKGAVFVTVLSNEEYDAALARAEKGSSDKAPAGKPWKQKRGAKNLKPLRPKHIEPKPEPEPEPNPEPVPEPKVDLEPEPEVETDPKPIEQQEAPAAPEEPQATPAAPIAASGADQPASTPTEEQQVPVVLAGDSPLDASRAASEERSDERRAVGRDVAGEGDGGRTPDHDERRAVEGHGCVPGEARVATEPSIHLTITYAPEPAETARPEPAGEKPAAEPAPAPTPQPVRAPRPSRPANDLPQDFYADVIVTDEPLSALYQVLPADVDPMATLEEDFRIARSTHSLAGTRSEISFPLRFLRKNGEPVMATLRRRARAVAGKRWALASIDADSPEEVGMGALKHKAAGPWAAFANEDQLKGAVSPEAELAQFAILGSWDQLLEQLSELAAPEYWGEDHVILREYLSMTYRRIARQHRLSMADDGSSAAFDTGLVTAGGETIAAILEPHDGDIQWELTCFSTNAKGQPATYLPYFAQPTASTGRTTEATFDELRRSIAEVTGPLRRALQQAVRNPRHATLAYDAVNDRVVGLLPVDGEVCAIVAGENGEAQAVATADALDAYICARVVSSEQPSWLVKMAKIEQAES